MDELRNQWYQASSLLVQAGFLIAGMWSVRAILKSMRASQEQMGALLKRTVSAGGGEDGASGHSRTTPYLLDGWPEPAQRTLSATSASQSAARRSLWRGLSTWLQQPMLHSGVSPWRKAVRWLQAPAGT